MKGVVQRVEAIHGNDVYFSFGAVCAYWVDLLEKTLRIGHGVKYLGRITMVRGQERLVETLETAFRQISTDLGGRYLFIGLTDDRDICF